MFISVGRISLSTERIDIVVPQLVVLSLGQVFRWWWVCWLWQIFVVGFADSRSDGRWSKGLGDVFRDSGDLSARYCLSYGLSLSLSQSFSAGNRLCHCRRSDRSRDDLGRWWKWCWS